MSVISKNEIFKLLSTIHFFDPFSPEELEEIIGDTSSIISYQPSEYIVEEGGNDTSFYAILKGTAQATKDAFPGIVISNMTHGSVFGEMSFLGKRRRYVNIIAHTEIVALRFRVSSFKKMSHDLQDKFTKQCIELLIKRIETLNKKLLKNLF